MRLELSQREQQASGYPISELKKWGSKLWSFDIDFDCWSSPCPWIRYWWIWSWHLSYSDPIDAKWQSITHWGWVGTSVKPKIRKHKWWSSRFGAGKPPEAHLASQLHNWLPHGGWPPQGGWRPEALWRAAGAIFVGPGLCPWPKSVQYSYPAPCPTNIAPATLQRSATPWRPATSQALGGLQVGPLESCLHWAYFFISIFH